MVQKSQGQPPEMDGARKPNVNNGISTTFPSTQKPQIYAKVQSGIPGTLYMFSFNAGRIPSYYNLHITAATNDATPIRTLIPQPQGLGE